MTPLTTDAVFGSGRPPQQITDQLWLCDRVIPPACNAEVYVGDEVAAMALIVEEFLELGHVVALKGPGAGALAETYR